MKLTAKNVATIAGIALAAVWLLGSTVDEKFPGPFEVRAKKDKK